ncbi:MAG: hypothetical protein JF887_08675 [Candidatus Dormibacteraeota bacterium]|uniref:Uncharacterized protein n=1 Tax=Candidatus Amunia macphersoniae TaxID=3127014 RepID=A0A934N9W5_9BACT|nr:hypothetical protein [Candidatus Dormibacteraeota bacterium]
MGANEPLLAGVGFVAAVLVSLVDGRNAVTWTCLAAGLGLAPAVASVYGADGALLLLAAAAAGAVAGPLSRVSARRVRWMAGIDPVVPVVAGADSLFGPRSIRIAAGVMVLPAASWVSFNIPLGSTSTVTGVLFPAAVIWGCAAMRLLTARTLVDIAVGVAAVGLAAAAAWLMSGGSDSLANAAAAAALAPAAAITAGWLGGHRGGIPASAPAAP